MTKRSDEPSRFRNFCSKSSFYFELLKLAVTVKFQREIELREPQQVLREKLGNELEVLDYSTDKLVNFGDNYASTIVKATIDIKNEGRTETLHLVAKMLPSSSFVRKFMQCDVIIAKEIFLYSEILPAYQKLCGGDFDIAPKFYGGRLNTPESGIKNGAVLLLENLKESGYAMGERLEGLTLDHLKIAVPAIAKFHAIGLAMKQNNPEFFSKIVEHSQPFEIPPEITEMFISKLLKTIKNKRELNKYYEAVKALKRLDSNGNHSLFHDLDLENPYACVIHRDPWINNMMFHRDADQKIDAIKLLDFQVYGISSPMMDLIYFLFTSLPKDFENLDEAVTLYRESICDALKKLQCDTNLFEGENFVERLKEDAKIELYRCLAMARNIEVRSGWDMIRFSMHALQRMKRILEIYDSKGWLDG